MPLTSDQLKIINHENGNILVSAAAGSGKTHTMIERIIRLIREKKASVENLLAVTFTEKSALDIKEKLKSALIKEINERGDKSLISQLNAVNTADISTIHSFCARILRTYFFKLDISPDFKIAADGESNAIIERSLDKTFREFYEQGEEWFYKIIEWHSHKRSDKNFREIILSAYYFCANEIDYKSFINKYREHFTEQGVEKFAREYKAIYLDGFLQDCRKKVEEAMRYFELKCKSKSESFCRNLISDIDKMLSKEEFSVIEEFIPYSLRADFDKTLEFDDLFYKDLAISVRDALKKRLDNVKKNISSVQSEKEKVGQYYQHIEGFSKILERFIDNYQKEKKDDNILDFNDLEHFALKVLKDQDVRKEVRDKYKFIFIDEFQDVNLVQEEIFNCIERDNRLMVGDLKQGIYAFRGCRSEIFENKLIKMPKENQTVAFLTKNFRSAKSVINMVNEVFRFCMTTPFVKTPYKDGEELNFGQLFPDGFDDRANLHYLPTAVKQKVKEQPRIYDVFEEIHKDYEQENDNIVALLVKIINEELCKTVYDAKQKVERPVKYGDIAILLRGRESEYVKDVIKGLSGRDIEVVSDTKENVCNYPEILMLINCLRLIDCFNQDIPLVSTLKSPIGRFLDEELYKIARFYADQNMRGSFVDAYKFYIEKGQGELKEKLLEFSGYFESLRTISDFVGASGALDKIIKDNDIESYLLASANGKSKVQRLKRFVQASVVDRKKLTIREFLDKVETNPDGFGMQECGDENAVKVMSMHSSKGLEFPVVIVCGLEKPFNQKDDSKEILFSREYGFIPRYYDEEKRTKSSNLFRGVVKVHQASDRVREEMRLFYVALTRATYSLHLVFTKEDCRQDVFEGASRFIDYIPKSIPIIVHNESDLDFVKLKRDKTKVIIANADKDYIKAIKERLDFSYPFIEDTLLPLKSDVTSATKNFEEGVYDSKVLFPDESTDTERGTIAHKILELFDFENDEGVFEQSQRMIERGQISEEDAKKVNLDRIESAITLSGLKNIKGKKLFREKRFLVEISGKEIFPNLTTDTPLVLQGIIDLLVLDGDTAMVIDYKYSNHSKEVLKARYQKQLQLYAGAVEKVLKKRVESKKIINIFTGEFVEID